MHEKISKHLRNQAGLYIGGELSPDDRTAFEKELEKSRALRSYLEDLQSSIDLISNLGTKEPTEAFLQGQRNLLRGRIDALQRESLSARFVRKFTRTVENIETVLLFPKRPALAAISYIIVGLIVGRVLFLSTSSTETPTSPPISLEQKIQKIMENQQLAVENIKYWGNGTEKVSFQLKAEDEFSYTGQINDVLVRELLFYLLLNDGNPGRRLRSVKLMSDFTADEQSEMVLVAALLSDQNPGIRLRAIRNLKSYPTGKHITDACIKVLLEDDNTAVRMEALNILAQNPDERLYPVLRVVSRLDGNEFIRNKAAELLDRMEGPAGLQPIGGDS